MFSSKSFIASGLIFSSLIHFEFIFVYRVKECSSFIFLYVAVQFSQHHLLKRLCFLHCLVCHRLIDHRCADLFLGFLFCSINLYFYFCASTILFGTCFYVCQRLVPNNPRTQEQNVILIFHLCFCMLTETKVMQSVFGWVWLQPAGYNQFLFKCLSSFFGPAAK